MKFLSKKLDSIVLSEGLVYRKSNPPKNAELKEKLLAEQHYFCAYTEQYVSPINACEVEHFDASLKNNDDYFNYYVVIRSANLWKKDEQYQQLKEHQDPKAAFFVSRFFQNAASLQQRIDYIAGDGLYSPLAENDAEAEGLIDFLDVNRYELCENRRKHIQRLTQVFEGYSAEQCLSYLGRFPEELSFITAIESEFGLDLSPFYR